MLSQAMPEEEVHQKKLFAPGAPGSWLAEICVKIPQFLVG